MTTISRLTFPTPTKAVFMRDGKVYTAVIKVLGGVRYVIEITSCSAPGRFQTYSRDRCPKLYADLEAVL